MPLTLDQQVDSLHSGDHVCLLYSSLDEQMTAIAPYLRRGLDRNELCFYVGDEAGRAALVKRLEQLGVDARAELANGRLRLMDPRAVYLPQGEFRPDETLTKLRALMAEAPALGFTGVRSAGDMSWALDGAPGTEHLIAYEQEVSELLAGSNFLGMWQYDRRRFRPRVVRDVLRTHPQAILGDKVCTNPYFEPKRLAADADDAARVDWMIAQLEQGRAVELGLQQLNRELESVAFAASHDLKEPARMVRMHLDLALRRAGAEMGADAKKCLKIAQASAERLTGLIEAILSANRRFEPRAADVSLREIVDESLTHLQAAIVESGASIAVKHLPTVRCDRTMLVRVFDNLIGNAIKFRREQPRIVIEALAGDDRLVIAVRDNGIGIPADWLPQAFGMFKRLHARDEYPGHGVGLATCRRLIEAHHGRIWVESREGVGSSFFFSLPCASARP